MRATPWTTGAESASATHLNPALTATDADGAVGHGPHSPHEPHEPPDQPALDSLGAAISDPIRAAAAGHALERTLDAAQRKKAVADAMTDAARRRAEGPHRH